MADLKLTDKQEFFCQQYIIDLNATQAAIRAGYSENSAKEQGSRLLTNANVSARVKELMDERIKEVGISQQWVITRLVEISDRCTQAKPVQEWDYEAKCFKETGEWEFDSNGAIKATELIGKHMGMFDKKKDEPEDKPVNIIIQTPDGVQYQPLATNEDEIDMTKDERYQRKSE